MAEFAALLAQYANVTLVREIYEHINLIIKPCYYKIASLLYDIIFVIISPVCVQIAAEVAAPLAQCKKVTLVSSGKGDVGAAKLTGEVFDIIERMPKMVESMTGVDLSKV